MGDLTLTYITAASRYVVGPNGAQKNGEHLVNAVYLSPANSRRIEENNSAGESRKPLDTEKIFSMGHYGKSGGKMFYQDNRGLHLSDEVPERDPPFPSELEFEVDEPKD